MADGSTVAVGMIGNDGMVGYGAVLGSGNAPNQVIVQVTGIALRISIAQFIKAFNPSESIRWVAHRCIGDARMLSSQTAACNRLHAMEQRLARWLLMACDRSRSDTVPMTHEFLAHMLGVRRSGVTLTFRELQRSGLISCHRGGVRILDPEALEALACERYRLDHERLKVPLCAILRRRRLPKNAGNRSRPNRVGGAVPLSSQCGVAEPPPPFNL